MYSFQVTLLPTVQSSDVGSHANGNDYPAKLNHEF